MESDSKNRGSNDQCNQPSAHRQTPGIRTANVGQNTGTPMSLPTSTHSRSRVVSSLHRPSQLTKTLSKAGSRERSGAHPGALFFPHRMHNPITHNHLPNFRPSTPIFSRAALYPIVQTCQSAPNPAIPSRAVTQQNEANLQLNIYQKSHPLFTPHWPLATSHVLPTTTIHKPQTKSKDLQSKLSENVRSTFALPALMQRRPGAAGPCGGGKAAVD